MTSGSQSRPSIAPSPEAVLAASQDMDPVAGTVEVNIPIAVLWEYFTHANQWSRWNPCFFWAYNPNLVLGQQLIWAFQPIRWWYLYKMPAIAKIVEVEPQQKVTWEVSALPGFYARHTYHMEDLGNGRTRFGSWEKATGWSFRGMKRFWIAHFTFVKDRSLEGAKQLEAIYQQTGKLTDQTVPRKNYWPFFLSLLLMLGLLGTGLTASWFYLSYVRQTVVGLAPGIHAVLGGGGNSVVVQDGKEVLLIDTKFPPGSQALHRWIDRHVDTPVTQVVNTHYHYDHTQGNALYPNAQFIAQSQVPTLMRQRDGDWWNQHPDSVPTETIDHSATLNIGKKKVVLTYPGVAHTHGDLVAYLPEEQIVATGDLLFHTYYPFFDLGKGGASIPGMVIALRQLAKQYPNATFVPGHGAIAHADDLLHHANYLDFLYQSVKQSIESGLSVEDAVKTIKLTQWHKKILPSFHEGKLSWATAANDIRWAYQLLQHSVN